LPTRGACVPLPTRSRLGGSVAMTIRLHRGDLPELTRYRAGAVAVDTETMGLELRRDRLCVVQLSNGDGTADVVQLPPAGVAAANLVALMRDPNVLKIFH